MVIRHAVESDLPEILAIYNASIPGRKATADTRPVGLGDRRAWFERHSSDRRPILIYENADKVAGWISFEDFYGRPAYRHTAELSLYVSPQYQGLGVGKALLDKAIQNGRDVGLRSLVGYIFAHNEPSLRLFRNFGFEDWGLLPNVADMDGNEYSLCILGKRID